MSKVLIIGAGIHGLTAGIKIAEYGYDVTIIEKNTDILQGTSGATHNRAHLGYHYPRSIKTAIECKEGLEHFKEKYPECVDHSNLSYYMIEKSGKTTLDEYKVFCDAVNIPFNKSWPEEDIIIKDNLEGSILTYEPVFDINKLRIVFKEQTEKLNIKLHLSSEVMRFEDKDGYHVFVTTNYDSLRIFESDIILNATYAATNNVLKILDLEKDVTFYEIQHTEVIVVRSKVELPSLTIMDGPFVSLMKYGGCPYHYLLYDAKFSIHKRKIGLYLENEKFETKFDQIIEHFSEYFPFAKDLKYIESRWGTRPIPVEVTGDARTTKIRSHSKYPGIYSIQEGKFISATLMAEQFLNIIQ